MIAENLQSIKEQLPSEVNLVAVSKFHSVEEIMEAYNAGQRVFGESRPQELAKKVSALPQDIEWHFIGHLQTNKLKMVLPYASLVQSVDSLHLLEAVNAWGVANSKRIDILLELHIGAEQTKQGFTEEEILDLCFRASSFKGVRFCGLMGMATNTDNEEDIRADFTRISDYMAYLKDLFPEMEAFKELSIGMSGDWQIALDYGATMVRIGTAIFGPRVSA
ncbi:MAG: YggS family pyridoxal phosphate-dependent enzyme [Bacteroidales bacterium]|nr:YggS family pyridoxal phosphate-dependent enzyme [Bacteroidales bacterium]